MSVWVHCSFTLAHPADALELADSEKGVEMTKSSSD